MRRLTRVSYTKRVSGQLLMLTILPKELHCGQQIPGKVDLGAHQKQVRRFGFANTYDTTMAAALVAIHIITQLRRPSRCDASAISIATATATMIQTWTAVTIVDVEMPRVHNPKDLWRQTY